MMSEEGLAHLVLASSFSYTYIHTRMEYGETNQGANVSRSHIYQRQVRSAITIMMDTH